jgi:hypothetical protein
MYIRMEKSLSLVFESEVRRELASSEDNKRRFESFRVLELLKK